MVDITFIQVCPSDEYFVWQTRVQLFNYRQFGYSENYQALIFIPNDRLNQSLSSWDRLAVDYPEAKFFFYQDEDNFIQTCKNFNYIPLLRLWTLCKHWELYPEMEKKRIFYHDSDIIFVKAFPFETLQTGINYLSDTKSYNGASYFDSKIKDVLPQKLEAYKKIDVLQETTRLVGISREIAEKNENNTGGAQYILENIDYSFWQDCLISCMAIKLHLAGINRIYFPSENAGFQSFCADMWAVLWNLWRRGRITETPKIMDFAWATDSISRWEEVYIYHDAGAVGNPKLFDKRKISYVNNQSTPYQDDLSFVSPDYCSKKYVEAIQLSKP